jgi:hypothetical protein
LAPAPDVQAVHAKMYRLWRTPPEWTGMSWRRPSKP